MRTIERKKKSSKNENNINIDINFADKEYIKEHIQEVLPLIISPELENEEEEEDDIEIDGLVKDLENIIKEFKNLKTNLIDKNIKIPSQLLTIPEISIEKKEDIINLISLLTFRIEKLKELLIFEKPILEKPILENNTMTNTNNNNLPSSLRQQKQFIPSLRPRILRPSFFGDEKVENARKELNQLDKFIKDRKILTSKDNDLIERAIILTNRTKQYIKSLLNDAQNSSRETKLLIETQKKIDNLLSKLMEKKLNNVLPTNQEPANEPVNEPVNEPLVEPTPVVEPEPVVEAENQEEEIEAPPRKRQSESNENYLIRLEVWLQKYQPLADADVNRNSALVQQVNRIIRKYKKISEELQGLLDLSYEEEIDLKLKNRLMKLRKYNNDLVSTGRSDLSVSRIRNLIEDEISNILTDRDTATPSQIEEYLKLRILVDNANGEIPTSIAFQNIITDIPPSKRNLEQNTRLNLEPIDMSEIRQSKPNARQIYYLFRDGKRLITTSTDLSEFENDLRSRFTEDGDIYRGSDLNQNENQNEDTPVSIDDDEERLEQERIKQERLEQLLSYRQSLFYNGRNNNIINSLNDEISEALIEDKIILLDRTSGRINEAVALMNIPINMRGDISNIQVIQLIGDPSGRNNLNSLIPNNLYINGAVARNENEQRYIFNEYGDIYTSDDLRGNSVSTQPAFQPTSRTDLTIDETDLTIDDTDDNSNFEEDDFEEVDGDDYDDEQGMINTDGGRRLP